MTGRFERRTPPVPASAAANGHGVPAQTVSNPEAGGMTRAELEERRDRLRRDLAERQWDLGGLAYEMAIRDHFRLDVLLARSAQLQQIDGELGEVDRILALHEAAATGICATCAAPHSRGAVFCWQCGTQLMPAATTA
jgi:hypothetical protein